MRDLFWRAWVVAWLGACVVTVLWIAGVEPGAFLAWVWGILH